MLDDFKKSWAFLRKHWVVISIIFGILAALFFIVKFPTLYFNWYYHGLDAKDRVIGEKDMRFLVAQIAAGVLAIIGLYFTYKRTKALDRSNEQQFERLAQEKEIFDATSKHNEEKLRQEKEKADKELLLQQYTKASELLASEDMSSRLSGIYLFEKIMNANEDYYKTITELLSAFIRDKRGIEHFDIDEVWEEREGLVYTIGKKIDISLDLQVALNVLLRRSSTTNQFTKFKIDLTKVYIKKASIIDYNIERVNFRHSIFQDCEFISNEFCDSNFSETYFENCELKNVLINNIGLWNVLFYKSKLTNNKYKSCFFSNTKFIKSKLEEIELEEVLFLPGAEGTDKAYEEILENIMEATIFNKIKIDDDFKDHVSRSNPDLYKKFCKINSLRY